MNLGKQKFFCFSPQVMLVTLIIEFALALYVWLRFKASAFTRLATLLIASLAIFQLAEYEVCAGSHTILWSRIGFAVISLLPIMGLHLLSIIRDKKTPWLALAYGVAVLFVAGFIFMSNAIVDAICGGNYNIFTLEPKLYIIHSIYYAFFLFLALLMAIRSLKTSDRKKHHLLIWVIIGYLSFMVPTVIIYLINRVVPTGIPSVMCGFAIMLAFIVAFKIVPLYTRK